MEKKVVSESDLTQFMSDYIDYLTSDFEKLGSPVAEANTLSISVRILARDGANTLHFLNLCNIATHIREISFDNIRFVSATTANSNDVFLMFTHNYELKD